MGKNVRSGLPVFLFRVVVDGPYARTCFADLGGLIHQLGVSRAPLKD
jgi:hypothetical protein